MFILSLSSSWQKSSFNQKRHRHRRSQGKETYADVFYVKIARTVRDILSFTCINRIFDVKNLMRNLFLWTGAKTFEGFYS